MACLGNIDVNILQGLKELRTYCGSNTEQFVSMVSMVLDGQASDGRFTEEFLNYENNKDLNLDAFKGEDGNKIRDAIIKFYYHKKPLTSNGTRLTKAFDKINTFGYTSIHARNFCVKNLANLIIMNYRMDFNNVDKVKERVSATYFNKAVSSLVFSFAANLYIKENATDLDLKQKDKYIEQHKKEIIELRDQILYSDDHKEEIDTYMKEHNISSDEILTNYRANILEFFSFIDHELEEGRELTKDFIEDVLRDERIGDIRKAKQMNTDIFLDQIEQEYEPLYDDLNKDKILVPEENKTNDTQETNTEESNSIEESEEEDNKEGSDDENDLEKQGISSNPWILQLNNKMGLYGSWLTHVDNEIRAILGSLEKLIIDEENPDGDPIRDTNTPLGVADVMDANACANVLYRFGQFGNINEMMDSIKRISRNLKGYEAFDTLYKLLDGDSQLQIRFYRTFSRTLMSKLEIVQDGALSYSRITNKDLHRRDLLSHRLIDSLKSTVLNVDEGQMQTDFDSLNNLYKIEKPSTDSALRIYSRQLADLYKKYFPFINEFAIVNYINNNRTNITIGKKVFKYKKDNFDTLLNELQRIIKEGVISKKKYYDLQITINLIDQSNKQHIKQGHPENVTPLDSLYSEGYLTTGLIALAEEAANRLQDYVLISSPLNTRNVNGNLNSDVINNSMITFVKRVLESKLNKTFRNSKNEIVFDENSPIVKFGEHKFRSLQYELSPIMVEHRNEDGSIINYGLFRRNPETNQYEPTDYSDKMLELALLDGASNIRSGTNALYSQMSGNDYLATAWKQFFNQDDAKSPRENMRMADYMFRIPADAPKNFIMRTFRYSTRGLVTLSPEAVEEENNLKDSIKNKFTIEPDVKNAFDSRVAKLAGNPVVVTKGGKYLNEDDFLKHITANADNPIEINIPIYLHNTLRKDEGKEITLTFRYKDSELDKRTSKRYLMKGTYVKGKLQDAVFVGVEKSKENSNQWETPAKYIANLAWNNILKEATATSDIKRVVNRNGQVYKILKNMFLQELKDMAVAANVMFKYDSKNQCVLTNPDGTPVFVNGIDNTNHNGLHIWYHFADKDDDGRGPIYINDNGWIVPTGKVFTSDRFKLYNFFATDQDPLEIQDFGEDVMKHFNLFRQFGQDSEDEILHYDENNNVILTPAQEEYINEMLDGYILASLDFSKESLKDISDFIGDRSDEEILDFALNYNIIYAASNDLFEGDTKFYKNTQTFLKRAKEVQGSGVSLGIVDLTRDHQPTYIPMTSALDKTIFTRVSDNGVKSAYTVKMYPTFRAVTVFNSVVTDSYTLETIAKALSNPDIMGSHAMSKDDADRLMDGYKKSVVNDAQSYITLDEFIRRVTAKGQLEKYKPIIDRILDESKDLTVEDIKAFIQVQKNFYYDQNYNEYTKVCACRQIKNAEFVLIPRLIRGTELELVAQMMEKLGVDQLNTSETSKASQAFRFTLWDNNGHLNEDVADDILNGEPGKYKSELFREVSKTTNNTAKEYYNYNYLYVQQETPQHVFNKNKAGIQILKKLLDNIGPNSNKDLKDLKEEFQKLYVANIKESYTSLLNRFNVITDEKGNIKVNDDGTIPIAEKDEFGNVISGGVDYKEFFQSLRDELMRLGLDSNMIDYCTPDPNSIIKPGTVMPNYMTLVAAKFENIVQSLFNNAITRQTLPGFHAAQVSAMGTATRYINIDDNGHKTLSDLVNNKLTSNKLHYHPKLYKHKTDDKAEKITEGEYERLDPARREEYLATGEISPYIEIMLPASAFGFDRKKYSHLNKEEQNAEFLKQLKAIGADTILGYRIPTEGKQSLALMKIVDFCDDAYGSTIFLPDAWVAQTGADFDIDSVYGITDYLYFDNKGVIHKEKMMTAAEIEKASLYLWEDYVAKAIGGRIEAMTDKEYDELVEKRDKVVTPAQAAKIALNTAKREAYKNLTEDAKEQLEIVRRSFRAKYKQLDRNTYKLLLENEIEVLDRELKHYNKDEDVEYAHINDYKTIVQQVIESIKTDTIGQANKEFSEAIKNYKQSQFDAYSKQAKERGLMSYEDYKKWAIANPIEANNKRARTNRLVEVIRKIVSDSETWEEHFSRSNFDDIKDAIKEFNIGDFATKREARTAYNIFSQSAFQEDAISGTVLKAFSVTRDTFCSVCNSVRPSLANNAQILVEYKLEGTKAEIEKQKQKLKERFGDIYIKPVPGSEDRVTVLHTMFGWSNDNKNVEGKLLTVYSSETTAHILDAVKSGNVQNVNLLTFQVYKTLVDVGSNYRTAVSFIMQPGISRIIKEYNKVNSIYSNEFGKNYVVKAIRQIFDELSISYEYGDNLAALLQKLNIVENEDGSIDQNIEESQYVRIARAIFKKDNFKFSEEDGNIGRIAINSDLNKDRLENKGIFEEDNDLAKALGTDARTIRLIYDIQTILQFSKLQNLATDIRTAAMVSNPDKFGAKQTIFETRDVFTRLVESLNNDVNTNGEPIFRLRVDDKHLLEAIYPLENIPRSIDDTPLDADDALKYILSHEEFINDSKYKSLAAFIKYATATSIMVNKNLFVTQTPEFIALVEGKEHGLLSALSGTRTLNKKIVKEFQKYIISYIVNQSRFLQAPLHYTKGKGFDYQDYKGRETNSEEIRRVLGLNHLPAHTVRKKVKVGKEEYYVQTPVTFEDINDPTQDELEKYTLLSPAQKVDFIKSHFSEVGMFEFIEPLLFINKNQFKLKIGRQPIRFYEDSADIETIRANFEQMFSHTNPIIAMAAADVLKYAFLVEGFSMGSRNVSKMIPNSVLLNDDNIYGTSIVNDSNFAMADLINTIINDGDLLIENFVRGHSEELGINLKTISKEEEKLLSKQSYRICRFDFDLTDKESIAKLEHFGVSYTKANGNLEHNKFVRFKYSDGQEFLYKVYMPNDNVSTLYLIPMNLLEPSECETFSANDRNNKFQLSTGDFMRLIDNFENARLRDALETKNEGEVFTNLINKFIQEHPERLYKADRLLSSINNLPFDLNTDEFDVTRKQISEAVERFKNKEEDSFRYHYFFDANLDNYMYGNGIENGHSQFVTLADDTNQLLTVYRFYNKRLFNKYVGEENIDKPIDNQDKQFEEYINIIRDGYRRAKAFTAKGQEVKMSPFSLIPYTVFVGDKSQFMRAINNASRIATHSTILDVASEVTKSMYRRSYTDDRDAQIIGREFKNLNISTKKENILRYTDDIFSYVGPYLKKTVDDLVDKMRHYIRDPRTGEYLPINDKRVMEIIRTNESERNAYLLTLMEPQKIISDFGIIKDLDVESEDTKTNQHLLEIKQAVEKVSNLSMIDDALKNYTTEYLDLVSTNPLVHTGMISILDGFYKTNWFNATFNDIQETSNPLIQLTMKRFQARVYARNMDAKMRVDEFVEKMKSFEKLAAERGESFSLDNIIDEYGDFRADFNQKFIEDRDALKSEVDETIRIHGKFSPEHILARLKFNKWKAEHLQQEVVKDFYDIINAAEERLTKPRTISVPNRFGGRTNLQIPSLLQKYSDYLKVRDERNQLVRKLKTNIHNVDLIRKIESLNAELHAILNFNNDVYYDPEDTSLLVSYYSSKELQKSLSDISIAWNKYYDFVPIPNFQSKYEEMKKIVDTYELSNQNPGLYENNEDYVRAKTWIYLNTEKIDNVNAKSIDAFEDYLNYPDDLDHIRGMLFARDLENKYKDKFGIFHPELVTEEDLEELYENLRKPNPEQDTWYPEGLAPSELSRTAVRAYNFLDERVFIGAQGLDDTAFTEDFFRGLRGENINEPKKGKVTMASKSNTKKWKETVTALNNLLAPYYDNTNKKIDFSRIPITKEGVEVLEKTKSLLDYLESISMPTTQAEDFRRKQFLKTYVKSRHNHIRWNMDIAYYNTLKTVDPHSNEDITAYKLALDKVMHSGRTSLDKRGKVRRHPRPILYDYMTLKDGVSKEAKDRFIDKKETERKRHFYENYIKRLKGKYFETFTKKQADLAAHRITQEEYDRWYRLHHRYNYYTHAMEPISMWWEVEPKQGYTVVPSSNYRKSTPRDGYFHSPDSFMQAKRNSGAFSGIDLGTTWDENKYYPELDFRNKEYNPNLGQIGNYKRGSAEYDNNTPISRTEKEAMDYIISILDSLAETSQSKRYFEHRHAPARRKGLDKLNGKQWVKELAKVAGYYYEPYDPNDWYDEVSYGRHKDRPMPMLETLKGVISDDFKTLEYKNIRSRNTAKNTDGTDVETEEQYNEYVKQIREENKEIAKKNKEVHKHLLDRDWVNVISDFIVKAGAYNAVIESKAELFYAQQMLAKYGVYKEGYNKYGKLIFKRDTASSTEAEAEYLTTPDKRLQEQFENQLKRILYDQYKSSNSPKLMKWMSTLQSFSSASFMMFNVKGGIANVTIGESQILGEAAARTFFGIKQMTKAKAFYCGGLGDYIANSGKDYSSTLQGAIIKHFDVIDYDEHTGVSRLTQNAAERLKRIRDYGYAPQTSGEHEMQNSALFAMLESHRLVDNTKNHNLYGEPRYRFMNYQEFIYELHEEALKAILTKEEGEDYLNFKEALKADANKMKDFAWFKKDFATQYALRKLTKAKEHEFVNKRKELVAKKKQEFYNDELHPTLMSQLRLGENGKLAFVHSDTSSGWLGKLDIETKDNGISEAIRILGEFKGRVVSVNKYIHGVYDKSGRAQLEKTFIGGLIMQYHKHIPIGLMKRYRIKGMYSEERGAVTKGFIGTLATFLKMPLSDVSDAKLLTPEEAETVKGIQVIFRYGVNLAMNMKLYYNMLPEYDRANLRRQWGDFCGVLAAVLVALGVKLAMDDDDDDSIALNLILYEADRLATEAGQYLPWILPTEGKKVIQSPMAANSIVTDVLGTMGHIAKYILSGGDYDMTYQTGKFAGENKIKVYLLRRIPIWRGIKTSFLDIVDNNHYYKLGQNMLGFLDIDKRVRKWKYDF